MGLKRRGRWILSGMLLALFIALCYAALEPLLWSWSFPLVPTPPPTFTPRPTSTFPPTRTPRPLHPAVTATPTPWPWDRAPTQYTLEARFDYLRQQVQVQEVITYTNTTGQPLDQIPLILEPARYPGLAGGEDPERARGEDPRRGQDRAVRGDLRGAGCPG